MECVIAGAEIKFPKVVILFGIAAAMP